MGVNIVRLANGETVVDMTGANITPSTVMAGYVGYGADGEPVVGTLVPAMHFSRNVNLPASGWNADNKQTVVVSGVLADALRCTVWVGCDISSNAVCEICGVECIVQLDDALTFQCTHVPDEDIVMNVSVLI